MKTIKTILSVSLCLAAAHCGSPFTTAPADADTAIDHTPPTTVTPPAVDVDVEASTDEADSGHDAQEAAAVIDAHPPEASTQEAGMAEAATEAAPDTSTTAPGCAADATILPIYALNVDVDLVTLGPMCVTFKGNIDGWFTGGYINRDVTVTGSTTQSYVLNSATQAGL